MCMLICVLVVNLGSGLLLVVMRCNWWIVGVSVLMCLM